MGTYSYQTTADDIYEASLAAQATARERGHKVARVTEVPQTLPPSGGQQLAPRMFRIQMTTPEGEDKPT